MTWNNFIHLVTESNLGIKQERNEKHLSWRMIKCLIFITTLVSINNYLLINNYNILITC